MEKAVRQRAEDEIRIERLAGMTLEEADKHLTQAGMMKDRLHTDDEMDSPYSEIWFNRSNSSETVAFHTHDFFEILLCTEGSLQYMIGTVMRELRSGDLVVIPPGLGHRPISLPRENSANSRYGMRVSMDFARELVSMFPDFPMPVTEVRFLRNFASISKPAVWSFEEAWEAVQTRTPLWEATVLAESIRILTEIGKAVLTTNEESETIPTPRPLNEILNYIEAHLSERITLEMLAKQYYVSKGYISRLFRQYIGISFYQYLLHRRLTESQKLIMQDVPLSQVSAMVGFSSYSNFYRAFLNTYQCSPSEYVEKKRYGQERLRIGQ